MYASRRRKKFRRNKIRTAFAFFFLFVFFFWFSLSISSGLNAMGAESEAKALPESRPANSAQGGKPVKQSKMGPDANKDGKRRNFYQVLEDVLADFEYDLRNGQVRGLKNLSIRNIATSQNVPNSFKKHMELLVTERIIQHSKARVIQCLPCRARKASLSGDNVIITSAENNATLLARIAKQTGIEYFMDIAFSYQPTGLILSMHIADAATSSIIWSRSYNSETSRAEAFRRGVDYSQIDEARRLENYVPITLYRPTLYYLFEKDVSEYTGVLAIGFRMVERYDNRKKEVGFELNYFLQSATLVGDTSASTSIYSGFNITLLFVHAWNLIGDLENYNKIRHSVLIGIGGTYASGFLGGLIRANYEFRLGKHWAATAVLGYRPSSTQFISGTGVGSISGLEFGIGVAALL